MQYSPNLDKNIQRIFYILLIANKLIFIEKQSKMNKSRLRQSRNNLIAERIKVDSFKFHIQNINQVKPCIKRQSPFRHTFSLSKFQNRYDKFMQSEKFKANEKLLKKMINIQEHQSSMVDKIQNFMYPRYKSLFDDNRNRKRIKVFKHIQKQNERLGSKLASISSNHNQRALSDKHMKNAFKRNLILDYRQAAKKQLRINRI